MTWDLACLGFSTTGEVLHGQLEAAAGDAEERLATEQGEYAIWRSRSGAEIWFHLAATVADDGEREIVGLTPFFEGRGEIAVRIERFEPSPDSAFEGHCTALLDLPTVGEDAGFAFQLLDSAAHGEVLAGTFVARLTGFAIRIQPFAPPMPASAALRAEPDSSQATVTISGEVKFRAVLTNETTRATFVSLTLSLGNGTIDLVAPDEAARDVREGDVIEATCRLIGRILE